MITIIIITIIININDNNDINESHLIILIIISKNALISILPKSPSSSWRVHISPEVDWNFPFKNCQKLGCSCIKKIRLGDISLRKKVRASKVSKIKNPTMIQLNRIQLTSQIPNHTEMTKILSTSQLESRIIDFQCLSGICFV